MHIHRIYTGDDGETHFDDMEVELEDGGPIGRLSPMETATGILFREVDADYDYAWYTAPRRQYIINLVGGVEITVSDGETRRIGPGEVFLVEDTTGPGHFSKALDGQPRRSIFVALD